MFGNKSKDSGTEHRILTAEIIEEILEKDNLGIPLKKHEKIWFDNLAGVRKSGLKYAMSDDELQEYIKCKKSIHYFAEKYCKIKREDGSVGPMRLREYQKRIVDLYNDNRFSILMASRQMGKTVSAAIYILYYCLFNDDKNVMIVANKGKTVIEIVDKIKSIYTLLPFFLKQGVIAYNQKQITFENNCKIKTEARSKTPAIGNSVDLLYLDEFAHIPSNIIVPYYTAAVPVVSSIKNSKIIITSTPKGYNLFHDLLINAERQLGDPLKNRYKALRCYWWEMDGRRDTKLSLNQVKLNKYAVKQPHLDKVYLLNKLKNDYGYQIYDYVEDSERFHNIKFDVNLENTHIDFIRRIRIDDVPLSELFIITNWEEEQTQLIGGADAFKQEFDLQFMSGNKLLFDNIIMEKITSSSCDFEYIDIEKFNKKTNLLYNELSFIKDKPDLFDINKAKSYNIIASIDLSEGIGGDYSVINLFRLMLKDEETLNRYKDTYSSVYECFKLEQIGVYRYNNYSIREIAHILYMIMFDLFDADKCKIVLEYNTFGGDLLNCMTGVFNDNNEYYNTIFCRYKHSQDKTVSKPGLKVNRNKNVLIKDFQDNVKKGNIVIHNQQNISEINMFSKCETPSGEITFKAENGNDDIIMSCITLASIFSHLDYKNMIDDIIATTMNGNLLETIRQKERSNTEDTNINFDNFSKGYRNVYKKNNNSNNYNNIYSNNPFQRNPWVN